MAPKARPSVMSSAQGRGFSIASFFDAASAGRRGPQRLSGHGFRIDRSGPSLAGLSSSSHTTDQAYHWSSGLANVEGLGGDSVAPESTAETGYSATMQAVRQRILDDLQGGDKKESGTSVSSSSAKLQQHRKRALAIAFGGEDDLMVSAVEFALTCPYSRLPLHVPVRSRLCSHVQCCDLDSWMVLMDKHKSLRDPKGPCPVCEQRVAASTLEVDVWMLHVLQQMPAGTHLVVLNADGSYHSGDITRDKRREEITMEVVDATQCDFENFLGDVIDDDDDVESAQEVASPGTKRLRDGTRTHGDSLSSMGARDDARAALLARSEPAGPTIVVKQEPTTLTQGTQDADTPERASAGPETVDTVSPTHMPHSSDLSQAPAPTQEDGVVIVHFIEPTAHGRALPSRIREWVFYCPECHAAQLKGEADAVGAAPNVPGTQTSSSSTGASPSPSALPPAGERCGNCGHTSRDEWSVVRRFNGTAPVTMELTADGTALLRGVDAAAPYLYRAGFTRTRFSPQEFQSPLPEGFRPAVGVWVTTGLLSRFEVDFLEACCERLAAGETDLESFEGMMVPALFRIPRRRRNGTAVNSTPNGRDFFVSQRR